MSNVQNPTYFLAPNWNFPPGGRIAIGNVVRNPLKPHIPLTKANISEPLATEQSRENNWRLSLETATTKRRGLWGIFLENVKLNIAANRERIKNGNFTMASLDTIYLSEDPSVEYIKARCNDPIVREYMRLDSVLCSPVYMVTGIKVAKGFQLEGEKSSSSGVDADVGGEVTAKVSAGLAAGATSTRKIGDKFEADGDIIFAYQLMKIKPKGWKKDKTFESSEHQPRQAFLAAERNAEVEVEGEIEEVNLEDIMALEKAKVVESDGGMVAFEGVE